MKRKLNSFDWWMVRQNVIFVEAEGLDAVVSRLKSQGYAYIAEAVVEQVKNNKRDISTMTESEALLALSVSAFNQIPSKSVSGYDGFDRTYDIAARIDRYFRDHFPIGPYTIREQARKVLKETAKA